MVHVSLSTNKDKHNGDDKNDGREVGGDVDGGGEMVEDATKTSMMVKTTGMAKTMEEKVEEMRTVGETAEDATTGEVRAIAGGKRSGLEAAEPRLSGGKKGRLLNTVLKVVEASGSFLDPNLVEKEGEVVGMGKSQRGCSCSIHKCCGTELLQQDKVCVEG
jgi:hypothetical protein